jgi:hypothetical protein
MDISTEFAKNSQYVGVFTAIRAGTMIGNDKPYPLILAYGVVNTRYPEIP